MRVPPTAIAVIGVLIAGCAREIAPSSHDAQSPDAARDVQSADIARDERPADVAHDAPPDADSAPDALDSLDVESLDAVPILVPTEPQPYASCIPTMSLDAGGPMPDASQPEDASLLEDAPRLLSDDVVVTPEQCPLPLSGTIEGSVTLGRAADGGFACPDGSSDACVRHVYAFTLTVPAVVDIGGSTNYHRQTVTIRSRCDDPSTTVPMHHASVADIAIWRDETVLGPGTWFADSLATGSDAVRLGFSIPASNYGCANPESVPFCTPIEVQGAGESFSWGGCNPPDDGRIDRFWSYRLDMPANSVLHVLGADVLSEGCGPRVVGQREAFLGPFDGGPVLLGISHPGRPFYFESLPAAPNRVCTSAARLTPGVPLQQNTGLAGLAPAHQGCQRDPSLYYLVEAPPRTATRVTATGRVALSVADSCAEAPASVAGRETLMTNDTDAPAQRIVRITSNTSSSGAAFTLAVDQFSRAEAAPNSFCESPLTLRDGVPATNQEPARAYAECDQCARYTHGAALYYRVVVPAHHSGNVTLSRRVQVFGPVHCGERPDGGEPVLLDWSSYPDHAFPLANEGDADLEVVFVVVSPSVLDDALAPFDIVWTDGG